MKINVRIDFTNRKQIDKRLKEFKSDLLNWHSEFKEIGSELEKRFSSDNFVTSGRFLGTPWQRLNPAYEEAKRTSFAGRGILERTGEMRKSFDSSADSRGVTIMNTVDYAIYHQKGRGVPRRPILGISDRVINIVRAIFEKSIKEKIRK